MSVTPEIEAEILAAFRQNPKRFSPVKVARQVGAATSEVVSVVNRNRDSLSNGHEHNNGEGRPDLHPYIVASRRAIDSGWDNDDAAVAGARAAFCAGTHTMATHRDGAFLHLCLFPLAKRRPARPDYFKPGVA